MTPSEKPPELKADPTTGETWLYFTADHATAAAATRFQQRFGRPPEQIIITNTRIPYLALGPVGEQEET